MKEFTNHIQVVLFNSTSTTISSGGSYDFMADHFEFQPVASDDSGGLLYDCDKTFVIDTPDDAVLRKFSIPRTCMVRLFCCDGSSVALGTAGIPARVTISRQLQRSQLRVSCKMVTNPLG